MSSVNICRTCTSVQDNNTYRLNLHGNKTTVTYNTGIEVVKTRILYIQRVVEYHHGMHNTGISKCEYYMKSQIWQRGRLGTDNKFC